MRRVLPLAALLSIASPAFAQENSAPMSFPDAYPETRRVDVVDEQFGVPVADPYRWLENDVRNDSEVADWVAAENEVTDAYLDTLPGRDIFAERIKALMDYERFGLPNKEGGRYFYMHNTGLQQQAVLWVRDTVDGPGRVLLDPNGWSEDGATALAEWSPSPDGKYLLYSIQDGGTDWRIVRVLDVATGETLSDEVKWAKYAIGGDWAKDGSGFFYARYPEPPAGETYQALTENHRVYFHKLGTDQSEDRLVYATPDHPKRSHYSGVTDDGRWLIIYTSEGTDDANELTVIDLTDPEWTPRTIVSGIENHWGVIGNVGDTLYVMTDKDAPRRRVMTIDLNDPQAGPATAKEIIGEQEATLDGASLIGGKLMLSYMVDARTEIRRFNPDGTPDGMVDLPGIGTASGFGGKQEDGETFYAFTSFNYPTTIFRYDVATGTSSVWAQPEVDFDPTQYVVEQRFYESKDGTRVPMFIVKRADVTGPAPTILYGYGGFNISLTPGFSASRLAWLEQGGVFAVANLRGGGEYGKAWHDGGRLQNKQNVFDDFIAAGEYLIAQGITGKDQLAIQGGSNGGLLVGAVVNQRPDLFAAALPAVGVMDMLRFDRWTAGRYWVDDYGYPSKEADFRVLYRYSPYHNVQSGKEYPAILVTTADTDDRVVPGHSFKYTAMLQSADIGNKPHLIRIETRAGHGSGKPTDKVIEETSDLWAFAAKWTGLEITPRD
ncbi:prolyl oligopeptidase family serine peptidase [Sphingosinithalassobacter portus]|uniref:prolyl oligopeptidase family serine peptidase n=1 Tax=Stakelama portus TaxID=2676234 RepID=UPI000D6E79F4|nr:prolyl oligopeptidase family serine peptidase [Sphingosinithalassobacter portus]